MITAPLTILFALAVNGSDLSGTWIGTWQHQGELQGACLYLLQGAQAVNGRFTYEHDTRTSPINAKPSGAGIIDFAIAGQNQGLSHLRLNVSNSVLEDIVLTGVATVNGQPESITFQKYEIPSIYYRFGQGRHDPVALRTSQPDYTPQARAAGLQGTVTLAVPIESSGAVGSGVKVVRGLGLGLDEEALKCVRKWQFTPPHPDCNPEPVYVTIELHFVLR